MRPAPYGASKRFCLWQKPCRRANSLRPRILICQGPQKSLLFWARAPTARAGVAGAGSVGVNCYGFHSVLLGRGWFLQHFEKKEGSALRGGSLFVCPKRNQKCPGGSRNRTGGGTARSSMPSPPRPPFYGGRIPDRWAIASGGQNLSGLLFLPRGHRPLPVQNLVDVALKSRRLAWKNQGSWAMIAGRWTSAPTKRLPVSCVGADVLIRPSDHARTNKAGLTAP